MSEEHEGYTDPLAEEPTQSPPEPIPAPPLPWHVGQRALEAMILKRGESVEIPARQMTPEMKAARPAWRERLGLEADDPPVVEDFIPILRAYVRPRFPEGEEPIGVKVAEDGSHVEVTGLILGAASVDVIDQASDPAGTTAFDAFHDFIVR
jgi:hypothetical protein